MKRFLVSLCALVGLAVGSSAQSFVDTFDANSLGWTECAYESSKGSAVIDKGVLTIKSKGENKAAGALLTAMSGVATKVGENTFLKPTVTLYLTLKNLSKLSLMSQLISSQMTGYVDSSLTTKTVATSTVSISIMKW